jgi:hypothetical protein
MIDYDELLEAFSIAAVVYNELGNGTLASLPVEVFSRIDEAVSKAIVVGIISAKWSLEDLNKETLDLIMDKLFLKLAES